MSARVVLHVSMASIAEAEVERLRAELGRATATLTQLRMESRHGSLESVRSALAGHTAAEQGETGGEVRG